VARAFDRVLPADRVLVLDAGRFSTAPGRYVDIPRGPPAIRHTAEAGSIGLGLGVAMGGAVARPDRTTVLFAGDGGFSMSLADLETVARHQLPMTVVVVDDGAYGAELRHLRDAGLPPDAALLPGIDFVAVARALGIEAYPPRSIAEPEHVGQPQPHGNSPLPLHCRMRRDLVVPRITWD
jgi:acetolactate synthase I/II/III large subunit